MDRNKKFDIFVYVVLLAFCAGAYYITVEGAAVQSARNRADVVGAWGFPQMLIALTAALAIAGAVKVVLDKGGAKISMAEPKEFVTLLLLIAASVAYFYVIRYIGYGVSTMLYAMFSMWWMGVRKPATIVITGVALTVILYAAFGLFLKADLPSGFLI